MDEKKIINVSDDTVNDLMKKVTDSCYNNGYISGCIDGIKAGKRIGENQGWTKGFLFTVITGATIYFACKMIKKTFDEAIDVCESESKMANNIVSENFKEVKEEKDESGSESV